VTNSARQKSPPRASREHSQPYTSANTHHRDTLPHFLLQYAYRPPNPQTKTPTMPLATHYAETAPPRAEIDSLTGPTVVEFGTSWCGHCRGAQPLIAEAFENHARLRHLKFEDGSGRALGRSFRVKLWPTLIFMKDGQEITRLVRPTNTEDIRDALALIDTPLPS
jgi:thioredoxin 1